MSALATIERRLDRHAIDQLRAEVVRLSGMVEALTAALDDAEQRARWAEDNSNFWEGIAEIERAGNTVGLTQSGEVVALPLAPGLNVGAILRADARDNIPKLEVLHGEELENSEADGSEAGGEAMTDALRWIAEWRQAKAKAGMAAHLGTLEYAQLNAPDSELGSDGDWLYQWVTLPEAAPVQDGLF